MNDFDGAPSRTFKVGAERRKNRRFQLMEGRFLTRQIVNNVSNGIYPVPAYSWCKVHASGLSAKSALVMVHVSLKNSENR